jgi:putative SOS response-associated peptidase YedK
MCGKISGTSSWREMAEQFRLLPSEPLKTAGIEPSDLITPASMQPIIRFVPGRLVLDIAEWGFPPRRPGRRPLINARCETMHVLPSFQPSFLRYRCGVPVNGFYKRQREVDGSRSLWRFALEPAESGRRSPLYALAGLFTVDREKRQRRFVIVTTEATERAAEIHERMPVVLNDRDLKIWLSPDSPPGVLQALCQPKDTPGLYAEPVAAKTASRTRQPDPRQGVLNL